MDLQKYIFLLFCQLDMLTSERSKSRTCVLDTASSIPRNPGHPALVAHYDLYTPKWSKHIFDEWEEVMRRNNNGEAEILLYFVGLHQWFCRVTLRA